MSGNICAATNSPSPCSKATTTSSTNPAPRGASSPTTPNASHQSHPELGRRSILEADGIRDKDIRTKKRLRATGATRGGILFERGSLFYLLRNRFYVGEVKYKGEILPGEQPAIMDRELFDAVQQKLTGHWSHRNHAKTKSDHLLTGLLYDDAGHRMIPTHATKAGIRYRYYASLPHLKGESKTTPVGSVSRIPATDIENIVIKSVKQHLGAQHGEPGASNAYGADRSLIAEHLARMDVHKNSLMVRLKVADQEESHSTD